MSQSAWTLRRITGALALSIAIASSVALAPATQVAAAGGVSVFVGYADSERAGGEFPNPWAGSPHLVFDGCTPITACTFDAGAVRLENDGATTVHIDAVSVHLGTCTYTWVSGVVLLPGWSLVTTQRGTAASPGCTGPDPTSFDSSDIPSTVGCTNDGLVPVVDVTADGVTTSSVDSGQVLNTGGADPGACTNANESTQWVPIGSKACPGLSLTLAPVTQTEPVGSTATVTATFANACGNPLSDVAVNLGVSAGPNAGMTASGVTDASGSASFSYSSLAPGTDTLHATVTNAVGFTTTSNAAAVDWTVEFAPGGGSFVIGNQNAALGSAVNFWGAQWAMNNPLSGGPAPRSFKGYADDPVAPSCGESWTSEPGNSTPPPDGPLPTYMAVVVTSSSHQAGPEISGDIVGIVVVKTDRGYAPNPGHRGMGTVVAVVCGATSPATVTSTAPPAHVTPPTASGGGLSSSPSAPAPAPACSSTVVGHLDHMPPGKQCGREVGSPRR